MTIDERNSRLDELYAINTSANERQGGAMNETYFEYPKLWEKEDCSYHFHKVYGELIKSIINGNTHLQRAVYKCK